MNHVLRKLAIAAAIAATAGGGWWAWSVYATERNAVDSEIARYKSGLEMREVELLDAGKVKKEFDELCAISLGATEEEANASIRRALNEMAAYVGLRKAQVSTSLARPVTNPAGKAKLREYLARSERERPDFYSLSATLTGEGSLEQSVRTLAMLEAQDWVCRVDGYGMRAFGKGEGIGLSITVTAMFLPGRKMTLGAESAGRIWSPIEEAQLDPWRTIVSKNVFREPPPPPPPVAPPVQPTAVVEAPPPPPPPAAPQPSLGDWRVSAVVQGRGGPELWITNEKTSETRMLGVGSQVLEAEFITGSGESARIRIGEETFEVRLGSTLAERKPVS